MGEVSDSRYTVQAGWDDVPHLTEKAKAELLDSTQPYLRDARAKGIPSLGSGAIYPIPESEVTAAPMMIPAYWPKAYGLDVGWNRTAAIWGAKDPLDGTIYCYSEYYQGKDRPVVHATGIKARGEWIRGLIDPAAHGRTQDEGKQLLTEYILAGLKVTPANNAIHPGIHRVWELLATGRLKFFSTLLNTFAEYRLYRRDEDGKIVKKNDHLMDALRYLIMSFDDAARVRPVGHIEGRTTSIADTTAGY